MKLTNSERSLKKPLVWLEIDGQKIRQNLKMIHALAPSAGMMAIVKANAYGLGAAGIAKIIENYVDSFGVVGIAEALTLRTDGIVKPIVNLGIYSPDDATTLLDYRISPSIFTAISLEDFASQAKKQRVKAGIWIKIDTGLGRLGIEYDKGFSLIRSAFDNKFINLKGVYSTLVEDEKFDQNQLRCFLKLKQQCVENNIAVPIWSIASSSALFLLPQSALDMIRIGIPLFGYYPSKEAENTKKINLLPALSFKTKVACVKELDPGESIFYRRNFIAKQKTRIAVLLPGYSYGLNSRLVNGGQVLIRGKKYPLVGGISATNCFADIGLDQNIETGDEVVIFGHQNGKKIHLEELCGLLDQSPYEFLSRIPEKVTRLYI